MTYLSEETKESIWNWLQILGCLGLFLGLLAGGVLFLVGLAESDKKIHEEIETMSCDELRQFLLEHGPFQTGFSKAERLFKYRPCE